MNILYCFLAAEGLIFLKRGYLPFYSPEKMPEPWLKESCVYKAAEVVTLSDQEFQDYLKGQYENLPLHLKDIVSFEYFQQQSQTKREEIEQSLVSQQGGRESSAPFSAEHVRDWRILSLFEHWQDMYLWQTLAAKGKGLVLEVELAASSFKEASYNQQAQHLSKVRQVGSWLPEDNLYYLFNRPANNVDSLSTEWRLIRQFDAADRKVSIQGEEIAMYRLPVKAIKRVILGYGCEPEYCREVKHYLSQDINYRHTECVQAQLDPKTLSLGFSAID